ncbi:ACP S-malonyltransferase [Streptomyces sp. NBC_01485]|uniref:ACP S-malonyltransferase n=1 Tax=Streptomyces sp. NBC_01485 TaxID=2903884 RepID=UPI002E345EBB|nr:ACP S-malonyltransferase [Streptomyces sp. NBC_01485]
MPSTKPSTTADPVSGRVPVPGAVVPATALLFPGQGAQRPGMGEPWRDTAHWKVVDQLSEACDRDLGRLLLHADAAELTRTDNAQIATFTLEMVILDALDTAVGGARPAVCAGHSLGEFAALTAAGVLTLEDAGRLVSERGAAMAEAARRVPGTMAVLVGPGVAAHAERLAARLRAGAEAQIWVANLNGPAQVVVSGTADAVAALAEEAEAAGTRAVRIPVGGAFHTPLMAAARPRLAAAVSAVALHPAHCPVIANVDARAHRSDPERWRDLMLRHLVMPVRWAGSMRTLAAVARGPLRLAELGPGSTLSGLARRLLPPEVPVRSVATPDQLAALVSDWWPADAA